MGMWGGMGGGGGGMGRDGMGGGRGMGGGGGGGGGMRGSLAASDEDLGKVFDWGLMSRLLAYIRPYKRRAQLGVGAMLVLQVASVAQPYLPGLAVDQIAKGDQQGLWLIVGLFLITALVSWFATFQQSYQMNRVG